MLDHFDALSEAERHEAAVEILRRVAPPSELPDEALVAAADEVFRELDAREAADARPLGLTSVGPPQRALRRTPAAGGVWSRDRPS